MRRLATLVVLALSVTLLGPGSAPARADERQPVPLGIDHFADMVVDEAHGRVFISQGRQGSDQVLVRRLDATAETVIPGLAGATGMELSADGRYLLVAVTDGAAVARVDAETLDVTLQPTGPGTCPHDVAETAGQIWFANFGCSADWLGALDPVTGAVTPEVAVGIPDSPILLASPQLPQTLILGGTIGEAGDSSLEVMTATGAPAPGLVTRASVEPPSQYDLELELSPDGGTIMVPRMRWSGAAYLSTDDLSPVREVMEPHYPRAGAFRADGVTAISTGMGDDSLAIYRPGAKNTWRRYDWQCCREIARGGLAFGARDLYVVDGYYTGEDYRLQTLTPRWTSDIDARVLKHRVQYGGEAVIEVGLRSRSSHRDVEVWQEDYWGEQTLVASGTVPVDSTTTFRVPVTAKVRFIVRYAGDEEVEPDEVSAGGAISEAGLTSRAWRTGHQEKGIRVVPVRRTAWFLAHLDGYQGKRRLYVEVEAKVRGRWRSLGDVDDMRPDENGYVAVYLDGRPDLRGVPLRMQARFLGDAVNFGVRTPWVRYEFR